MSLLKKHDGPTATRCGQGYGCEAHEHLTGHTVDPCHRPAVWVVTMIDTDFWYCDQHLRTSHPQLYKQTREPKRGKVQYSGKGVE